MSNQENMLFRQFRGCEDRPATPNRSLMIRLLNAALIMAILVPTLTGSIQSFPEIVASAAMIEKTEYRDFGGEFDPTMGAKIDSDTGNALVVVHEKYLLRYYPELNADNPNYLKYLNDLDAAKKEAAAKNDITIIVVDRGTIEEGGVVLEPHPNTLYYITEPLSGDGAPTFVYQGTLYTQFSSVDSVYAPPAFSQGSENIWQILQNAGVKNAVMAGEWRERCPADVATSIKGYSDINVYWCDECAYPTISAYPDHSIYPTLTP